MTGAVAAAGVYSASPPASLVSLSNQEISTGHIHIDRAYYVLTNSGTVTDNTNVLEAWLHGGTASNYEARATMSYGTTPDGTFGSWLSLSSTQTWTLTNSASDDSTATTVMLVEIRLASSGVVQASATITLNATSYS